MSLRFSRGAFFGTFPMKNGRLGWWSNYDAPDPLPPSQQVRGLKNVVSGDCFGKAWEEKFSGSKTYSTDWLKLIFSIHEHYRGGTRIRECSLWWNSPNSGRELSLVGRQFSSYPCIIAHEISFECNVQERRGNEKGEGMRKAGEWEKARVENISEAGIQQNDTM